MNRTIAAGLAAATFCASASAQTQWIMEFDRPWVTQASPTVTIRLLAEFPPEYTAFAAAQLDFHASEPGWSNPAVLLAPPHNPGVISGNVITGITGGQVHFPPMYPANPANPIAFYEVQWTATDFSRRTIEFHTHTHRYDVYLIPVPPAPPRLLPYLVEGRGQIRIVPAPATALILALTATTALRRHRRRPDTRESQ